jgi:O-antigen/teichoic acid export membrane protein/SAM-dependent methyltransferase
VRDKGETAQTAEYVRLARDGAVNYGGYLVAALIGFAVVPILLHRLGAEAYGVLVVALTCAALVGFLDVGLGSSVMREVADASPDTEPFLGSASSVFAAFGAAGALLIGGLGPISHMLGLAPDISETPLVFVFVGIAFFGDQVTLYHTAVLGGLRRFDLTNGMLVGSIAWRAAGAVTLLLAGAGVATVGAWYAASAWLWALFNALAVRRISSRHAFRPITPVGAVLRSRIGFGAGSTAITAAIGSIWYAGPLMVAAVDGAAASALYQVSQRFPLAVMALPERVSVTLFPAASEQARHGGPASAARLMGGGARLIAVAVLPVGVLLLVTADDLLRAWLGSVPPDGALILRLTTLAVVAQALSASALQVLWGWGEVRELAISLAAIASAAVAGMGALALALGPPGAALALAAAAALAAASVLVLAARLSGRSVVALLGPTVADLVWPTLACAAVAAAVIALDVGDGWVELATVGGASIAAYLIVLVVLGRDDLERKVAEAIVLSARRLRARVGRGLRSRLRRHPRLRSAVYLAIELRATAADTLGRNRSASLAAYQKPDPWGYGRAWGTGHLELTERLINVATSEGPVHRALDIGCGEGWFTERLLSRCEEVVAVDISPVALERARRRCGGAPHVHFERWDLFEGRSLGEFDLVLALGVLELFRRPRILRRARRRILDTIVPGGHLLVRTTKQNPVVEDAGWSAVLVRGSRPIDRFLRASGRLELRAQEESDTHTITLYRHTSPVRRDGNA